MNKYTILLIAFFCTGILEAKESAKKGKVMAKTKVSSEKVEKKSANLINKKKDSKNSNDKSLVPIPVTEEKKTDDDVVIDLN